MSSAPATYIVRRADQRAALTSPLRLEILEHFLVAGPASVAEIADRMGRAADSLYYHVRLLVKVGLLRQRGTRKSGKRDEALYALVAPRIDLSCKPGSPASTASTMKTMVSAFRLAEREMRAALDDRTLRQDGRDRNFYAARMRCELSRKALADVNRHLTAIEAIFLRELKNPARGTACSLTVAMVPSLDHGRRRT